jgi:hypothetical protein
MSWQIHCIENTVKVSKKCIKEIYKAQLYDQDDPDGGGHVFYAEDEVSDGSGLLFFNSDHCEHQDFISNNKNIRDILQKHKVRGVVAFQDVEQSSDAFGDYWKHVFDGEGGYKFYRGVATIQWTEDSL